MAAEVLAIWIGLALLNGPLDTPHAAVAWISSVVGAHFFALAVVWRNPLFSWLGAALLGCGAVGLTSVPSSTAAALPSDCGFLAVMSITPVIGVTERKLVRRRQLVG